MSIEPARGIYPRHASAATRQMLLLRRTEPRRHVGPATARPLIRYHGVFAHASCWRGADHPAAAFARKCSSVPAPADLLTFVIEKELRRRSWSNPPADD